MSSSPASSRVICLVEVLLRRRCCAHFWWRGTRSTLPPPPTMPPHPPTAVFSYSLTPPQPLPVLYRKELSRSFPPTLSTHLPLHLSYLSTAPPHYPPPPQTSSSVSSATPPRLRKRGSQVGKKAAGAAGIPLLASPLSEGLPAYGREKQHVLACSKDPISLHFPPHH